MRVRAHDLTFWSLSGAALLYSTQIVSEIPAQGIFLISILLVLFDSFVFKRSSLLVLRKLRLVFWMFFGLLLYLGIHALVQKDPKTFERCVQVFIAMTVFAGTAVIASNVKWRSRRAGNSIAIEIFEFLSVLAFTLFLTLYAGDSKNRYSYSLFFSIVLIDVLLFSAGRKTITWAVTTTLAYGAFVGLVTDTRALSGYCIIAAVLYFVLAKIRYSLLVDRVVMLACIPLIVIYTAFYETLVSYYDAYLTSGNSSARTALSGRQDIWPQYITLFQRDPIWGIGPSQLPNIENAQGYTVSAHNFFLHFIAQYGVVGITFVALVLMVAWIRVTKVQVYRPYFAVLIFLVVLANVNEVFLLQNIFFVGMCQWGIVGTAAGMVFRKNS